MKEIKSYTNDLVFVILHYNVYKETINCINSIKSKIDTSKFHIVVVDNFSPNNSGKLLENKYKNDDKVSVILNKSNIGFAKGNNVGIDYARQILNPKFICCLNNDTLLEQDDFFINISKEYDKSNAAIIGPKIVLKDNSIQKFNTKLKTIEEYKLELDDLIMKKKKTYKEYLKQFKFIKKLNSLRKGILMSKKNYNIRQTNVVLHGCCLIFTPKFFEKLNGFNLKTFMFREEELLYIDIMKNNLISVYLPVIKIRHLEDVATDSIYKNSNEKDKFLRDNQIESLKVLIKVMEETKKR